MESRDAYLERTSKHKPWVAGTPTGKKQTPTKRKADEVYERPWPLRIRGGRLQGLKQGATCSDCLTRDGTLNLLGAPRRHAQLGFNLANGCEGCGGTGNGMGVWVDITDALKKLTLKQRFVIERRYGLGGDGNRYTQQQIADVLGVEQPTVAEHERMAKQRIREYLKSSFPSTL